MNRKNRNDYKKRLHQWKLIDERSGFVIYSNDAIMDDHKLIMSKKEYDSILWTEIPPEAINDFHPVPLMRLEPEDYFITENDVQYAQATWDNDPGTWSSTDVGAWEDNTIL